MSDSLAGIDKVHELTIRYLDANYDLKGKTVEEYAYEYESFIPSNISCSKRST
ncbi:TPA: hypothetical protein ACG3GO_002563 [Clostridioides difficile]